MNNPDNYNFNDGSTERITMSGQANWDPTQSISFKSSSTFLFSMSVMWADLNKDFTYPDWPRAKISATECGLYLCIKELSTDTKNGTLTETSKEIAATREVGSYQDIGAPTEQSLEIRALYDDAKRSDLQIRMPHDSLSLSHFDYVNVSQSAIKGLIWYFNNAFDDGSLWAQLPDPETRTIHMQQLVPSITGLVRLVPDTHRNDRIGIIAINSKRLNPRKLLPQTFVVLLELLINQSLPVDMCHLSTTQRQNHDL